ncbi:hypothetical protein LTR10_000325 [Elasticomyces elasticus]|nr:hypothetical protein LTR10_000325 [Elasticomyces elasticus]
MSTTITLDTTRTRGSRYDMNLSVATSTATCTPRFGFAGQYAADLEGGASSASDDESIDGSVWDESFFEPLDNTCHKATTMYWHFETQLVYEYTRFRDTLDIRILELTLDGLKHDADTIYCSLRTVSLSCPPPYLTLSYAWGPTKPDGTHLSKTVVCDGCQVPVTPTLEQALRRVRSRMINGKLSRTGCGNRIWVDFLCINHKDLNERKHQVELMAQIYKMSVHLLVWLGDDDAPKCRAKDLVTRSWFRRRWIIQEFLFAESIWFLYADQDISLADLVAEVIAVDCVPSLFTLGHTNIGQKPLLHFLEVLAGSQCSDERDTVFALMSMSSDCHHFQVDYTKSRNDVYASVAYYYLYKGHFNRILRHASEDRRSLTDTKSSDDLASWIPDWAHLPTSTDSDCMLTYFESDTIDEPYVPWDLKRGLESNELYLDAWLLPRSDTIDWARTEKAVGHGTSNDSRRRLRFKEGFEAMWESPDSGQSKTWHLDSWERTRFRHWLEVVESAYDAHDNICLLPAWSALDQRRTLALRIRFLRPDSSKASRPEQSNANPWRLYREVHTEIRCRLISVIEVRTYFDMHSDTDPTSVSPSDTKVTDPRWRKSKPLHQLPWKTLKIEQYTGRADAKLVDYDSHRRFKSPRHIHYLTDRPGSV